MKHFSKLVLFMLGVMLFINSSLAQPYSENFNSESLRGWYTQDNSVPRSKEGADWGVTGSREGFFTGGYGESLNGTFGGALGDIGLSNLPFGSLISPLLTYRYNFASVGYTEDDFDNAMISKWLVSPKLNDIKNGDVISFKTKQRVYDASDKLLSLFMQDANGVTDGNRPNRLEVRLSITSPVYVEEPNIGADVDAVGEFDRQLTVINPTLTVGGYPGDWQTITITISGLPQGKAFTGRIGFWYRYNNGGYGNKRARAVTPPPALVYTTAVTSELVGELSEPAGKALDAFQFGASVIDNLATNNQRGVNGSFIGIDEFQYTPNPASYLKEAYSNNVYYPGTGGDHCRLKYDGFHACSNPSDFEKTYVYKNNSSSSITIFPSIEVGSTFFSVSPNTATIVPAGESTIVRVLLKDGLVAREESGVLSIRANNNQGAYLALVTLKGKVNPPKPPVAICSPFSAEVTLNSSGVGILGNPAEFNNGSVNGCGTSENLNIGLTSRPWENTVANSLYFSCADVGNQTRYLIVKDNNYPTSPSMFSTCPIKITVRPFQPTLNCNDTQRYYITNSIKTMPISAIIPPSTTNGNGCNTPKIIGFTEKDFRTFSNLLPSLAVGKYDVSWEYTPERTCTKHVQVIDTIKPFAACVDTARVGFIYTIPGQGTFVKQGVWAREDIDDKLYPSDDNSAIGKIGIFKYQISTPSYNNGAWSEFPFGIPFNCDSVGKGFPVSMKVIDRSGNFSTCNSYVKVLDPSIPKCRNIEIALNPITGTQTITLGDVFENGNNSTCGIKNITLSKSTFECLNSNQTIPITVSYLTASNQPRSCDANVTVKPYSADIGGCADTIIFDVENRTTRDITFTAPLKSKCLSALPWNLTVVGTGVTDLSLTGPTTLRLTPGYYPATRSTIYEGNTYQCAQVYHVRDTTPPELAFTPVNDSVYYSDPGNNCSAHFDIPNPFVQGTYYKWTYTLTGATNKTVEISERNYIYWDTYWLPQPDNFNVGNTLVTLTAYDYAGGTTTTSYTVKFKVQNQHPPIVSMPIHIKDNIVIVDDFCGPNYLLKIPSALKRRCEVDTTQYMWYYEVVGSNGAVLFEQDSIHQDSGATIPLQVYAYNGNGLNYFGRIKFGYHGLNYGDKKPMNNYFNYSVIDTFYKPRCTESITVYNSNTTNYTYSYTIPPPEGICAGAYWGYNITGATKTKSTTNGSNVYNANQQFTLNSITDTSLITSIPGNVSPTVELNIGTNIIKLRILEESGNSSAYFAHSQPECVYTVTVLDTTTPTITCTRNDTLHRTSISSCYVSAADSCSQVTGFTGPFGVTRLRAFGSNSKIKFDKSQMPSSIKFIATRDNTSPNASYTILSFNCAGTVSFTWEYQAQSPQFFRPFIVKDTFNPIAYTQPKPAGFVQNNAGVQTGTYSVTVEAGSKLYIGVSEAGGTNGYLKISNLSAPYSNPSATIHQPLFAENSALYYKSNLETKYLIGNHKIKYTLTNTNSGRQAECNQQLTIIDDSASTLSCSNQTLYLADAGILLLKPSNIISTCFPVSSTTLSKDTFDCSDIGTQTDTIRSIRQQGDTLTCVFNVTVIDTLKPRANKLLLTLALPVSGILLLTDSMIKTFFYDNCGINTVSASKTSFNCSNIGREKVLLTATDYSGNSISINATIEITPGFKGPDAVIPVLNLCTGNADTLTYNQNPGYTLDYQWQVKEKIDTAHYWNYYTCSQTAGLASGSTQVPKFFKVGNDNFYGIYNFGTSEIQFNKLDTISHIWKPALASIAADNNQWEILLAPVYDPYAGSKIILGQLDVFGSKFKTHIFRSDNAWFATNPGDYDYFTHPISSPGWGIFSSSNNSIDKLFASNSTFYPVKTNGDVFNVKVDYNLFTSQYSYFLDSVLHVNSGTRWPNYKYIFYDPAVSVNITYITNGQKITAIRNSAGQNILYESILDWQGRITGKDSLTVDPTGNSSLFKMNTFGNDDYIAYKSANGKACVKKYTGSNSWSNIGSLDFSTEQINLINIGVVNNELFVVYAEVTGNMFVKKLSNGNWIDMGAPLNNISLTGVLQTFGNEISIVDLNGEPGVYFQTNAPAKSHLIKLDGWKNIPAATNQKYGINTAVAAENEYRCLASNSCISAPSQVYKAIITKTPTITAAKEQKVVLNSTASIVAITDGENSFWNINRNDIFPLSSGNNFTAPFIDRDTAFYSYAKNGTCYSDTIATKIYALGAPVLSYNQSIYDDTICASNAATIDIDSVNFRHSFSLYKKDTTGEFQFINWLYTPYYFEEKISLTDYPTQTSEYKIKVQERMLDAANLDLFYADNYLELDHTPIPTSDEMTIEGWVYSSDTGPWASLVVNNSSVNNQDAPYSSHNWEWRGSNFNVYYGNSLRQISFPQLPVSWDWVHVATTVSPNCMKIFYNGVLVAYDSSFKQGNINNLPGKIKIGQNISGDRAYNLRGFDEFRVWGTERTETDIAANYNNCVSELDPSLLIYTPFNDYNYVTETYTSLKGSNVKYKGAEDKMVIPFMGRDGSCRTPLDTNGYFLPPVKFTILENQAQITSYPPYHSSSLDAPICGGKVIQLIANSNAQNGAVNWYNAFRGGDLVGTNNALNIYVDRDTVLYSQAFGSRCERKRTYVEVVSFPEIISVYADTICPGEYFDMEVETDDGAWGYKVYDSITGGTEIDRWDLNPNNNDTLWIEAYNQYCTSLTRTPLVAHVRPAPTVISVKDSFAYAGERVTLEAVVQNGYAYWEGYGANEDTGSIFITPILNSTKIYRVFAANAACYLDTEEAPYTEAIATILEYQVNYDTAVACGSYTWIDSITYTESNPDMTYRKTNLIGNDSLYHLDLTIISFNNDEPMVSRNNLCGGDSTTIIALGAKAGQKYSLINAATDSTIAGPVLADGSNIIYNTGALFTPKTYKIMMYDTVVVGTQTKGCAQQLGNNFTVNAGVVPNIKDTNTCSSYFWRGNMYAVSGTYYDTTVSFSGCDSISILNLTVNSAVSTIDTVVACNTYTWHGTTYTASTNAPNWTGTTINGCDSVVSLNLTIIQQTTSTDTQTHWDTYTWMNGVTYISSNNTATDTLINVFGCDSVITLNLTIINSVARTWYNPQAICPGSSYTINMHLYSVAGNYRDTFNTATGYDSIIVTQLTISPVYSISNLQSICIGNSYTLNGHSYTSAGTYNDTLYSVYGCDSIIVTQLTINPKPLTSNITGQINPSFGSTETYSVVNSATSTYNWIITNGTQVSGGNTHNISVLWNSVLGSTSVKVIETNALGCIGDTVAQQVTLPVNLLSFDAIKKYKAVELKWSTSSEQNNKGFDVERSFDANTFEPIGFVNGNGTTNQISNYGYTDVNYHTVSIQDPPIIYYRLKQLDFNSNFDYSKVVAVFNKLNTKNSVNVEAIPNPYKTGFDLTIYSQTENEAVIEIYDAYGKRVANKTTTVIAGKSLLNIEHADEWKTGMYFIVVDIDNKRNTIKIVKE